MESSTIGMKMSTVLYCRGYDLEKEILMVNDSLEGVVERDLESFAFIYNETGQYALAIL